MNKLLLGVLALSTVATFAEGKYQDYHGYLDAEVSVEAKNDFDLAAKSFKNSGRPAEAKAFTSLKLGHTLYKDAQIAVFGGLKGDVYKYTSTPTSEYLNIKDYYFGARWDAPIVDGYNVALTFANKGVVKDTADKKVEGGYTTSKKEIEGVETGAILQKLKPKSSEVVVEDQTVLKDAVSKHLEAKGKKASTDEEYENEGYKLHNAEDTTLLSAVLTGKVGGFDSHLGGIYSTRDFKDGKHTLESFVRTSGMADENVKVEGFLNHYLTSRDVDGFTTGNYAFGGRLKGGVKVTTNLNKDTMLTNKAEFKLLNILSSKAAADGSTTHKGEALTENELKYTGFNNFVVTTGLNYKNEFETGAAKELKHTPEVKLGVEYANNGLTASTKNSEKVELTQKLADNSLKYKNLFETANKLGYMKDGFGVEGSAKYNLETEFNTDRTHKHNLLAGLKLSYGVDNLKYEDYKVDSVLSGNYLLTATNKNFEKANGQLMHEVFAFTKNNVQLNDVFGLDLSGRLNAYNYTNVNYADATKADHTMTGFLLTDAGLTVTKKLDKLTTSLDVNGKYGLYAKEYKKDSLQHHASAEATIKADYLALSNVDLIGEVKGEYNYNKLGGKLYEGLASFVENNRDKDGYRTLPKYLSEKFDAKAEHDMLDQYENLMKDEKNHELNVKPSVSAVIRLANDKLTITPKLGAEVSFSTDVKNTKEDLKPFLFKSVKGIGSLNINYAW